MSRIALSKGSAALDAHSRKYSRWTWVIFTDNMRQETLFGGLVACFNALGFVPWVLVFAV